MDELNFGLGAASVRSVRERLFDQRVVFVTGTLDHQASGQAAMELMTLDASGDDPILLRLECAREILTRRSP